MSNSRKAYIILAGSELTEGRIKDEYASVIAAELTSLGFSVAGISIVPDNNNVIEIIKTIASSPSILVFTGGLGPTSDDLTRSQIAEAAEKDLVFLPSQWRKIKKKHLNLPEINKNQCYIPEGFHVLENQKGTAPGFYGSIEKCTVFSLPGPPSELFPMFYNGVLPLLAGKPPEKRLWGTCVGVAESKLEKMLQNALKGENVAWGTRAGEYAVIFYLSGGDEAAQQAVFQRLIFQADDIHFFEGIVDPLLCAVNSIKKAGLLVSGAESCTGGLVSSLFTSLAGSSEYFWGSWVTYANSAKIMNLGISETLLNSAGAVSREIVTSMADQACTKSGSNIAYAISGIAGPGGGSPEKPVGTVWIAVSAAGKKSEAKKFLFGGSRESVRRKAAAVTLMMISRYIKAEF